MIDIANNLASINKQIREYEITYHRKPESVFLLAASKGQSADKLQQAIDAGQLAFGENYLQEALEKQAILANQPIEWHFIGTIQSNKTKKIAEHFNWVHSVSDKRICERLNNQRPANLPPLNVCLEVNVSNEPTKSGINLDEVMSLVEYCASLPRLKLRGLMTIPIPSEDFNAQRAEFNKLSVLFAELNKKNYNLDTLSMGMSHDMQAAIAEGATIVRVGTAIFGSRFRL